MIILGLGSNLGNKLSHLRKAAAAIKQLPHLEVTAISPVYRSDALLHDEIKTGTDPSFLNLAMRCNTSLTPKACLAELKKIETNLGREPIPARWAPRVIDIDILAWEDQVADEEALVLPHAGLLDRPFALWPLADVAPHWIYPREGGSQGKTAAMLCEKWGPRFTGEAPLHTQQIHQRVEPPELVGILNVTPDSFSDGNQYMAAEHALARAIYLVNSGASIIDIGAESTAPKALPVTKEIEWQRLQPILAVILAAKNTFLIPPKISVDTYHPETAALALQMGVDWINDVTGFSDSRMREIAAQSAADCVMMHHLSLPASQYHLLDRRHDPVPPVHDWAAQQIDVLEKTGIARERIIFDPGIGFGKAAEHSLSLINHIGRFRDLGVRLLTGHSRKSFMTLFSAHPAEERDIETAVMTLYLASVPVDYVRVHNVDFCARALKVDYFL